MTSDRRRGTQQDQGALMQEEGGINLLELLYHLLFYRVYFFVVVLVCSVAAIIHAWTATPIYTADALLQVDSQNAGVSSLAAFSEVGGGGLGGASAVPEEIEIIRSRSVISRVVEKLQLNVVIGVDNRLPLIGDWLTRVLPKSKDGLTDPLFGMAALGSYSWGGESLVLSHIRVPDRLVDEPLVLRVGEAQSWVLEVASDGRELISGQGFGQLATSKDGSVKLEIEALRARSGTLFRLVVTSPFNRVGAVLGGLQATSVRGTNLIDIVFNHPNPLEAMRILNAIAEVYVEQNLERRSAEAEKTLEFLRIELPKLRAQLDGAELALNNFRIDTETLDISYELQELLSLSTALETRLFELKLKQRELSQRYDQTYPAMQTIADQLRLLQSERDVVSGRIKKLPAIQQDYIRLARDVDVNNQLYVSLLNSVQQLEIAKAGTVGNVAIIDRPILPRAPSKPNKTQIVVIGIFIGILLGFLLVQLMAFMNKVVRDPKKLELDIGIPTLSILPLDREQISRAESGNQSVYMLAREAPNGRGTEALRSLCTALLFALSEKPRSKVILITSAVPLQGKSFVSANLSFLMGATGKRVLLIDADIRKSSLHRYLEFDPKGVGLSSVLRGETPLDKAIIPNAYENLDFLPPGPWERNPGDLLAGEKIQEIIHILADRYDFVLIDSPPLLPVHDARALGKAADVSLFVARQDALSLFEVQDGIDVFNKSGNRFDGVIFNGFIPSRIRYGYGFDYGDQGKLGKFGRFRRHGHYGKHATYDKSGQHYDSADGDKG
jgi:tyrosine-protein kinase Etk/Wzc